MNCKKIWSNEFIMENFDKKWVNKNYIPHIGRVIREKERLLLPETQNEASLIKNIRLISKSISELPTNDRIKRKYKKNSGEYFENLSNKNILRKKYIQELNELKSQSLTYTAINKRIETKKVDKKTKYISKCPYDNCRGFISDTFTCGTCNGIVCEYCHIPKIDEKHKCNKDDVKSANTIINETKNCPKCITPIWRASGCAQMYCTYCHTAFNWNTLEIDNGIIHNPHYYEYMSSRNQLINQDIEMIACGEIPDINMLSIFISSLNDHHLNSYYFREKKQIFELHRFAIHFRNVIMPEFTINRIKDNYDLRIAYLLDEFDDDEWAMKLANREKKRMKEIALRELSQMITIILEDTIRQFISKITDIYVTVNQYQSLMEYFENSLQRVISIHGGNIPIYLKW